MTRCSHGAPLEHKCAECVQEALRREEERRRAEMKAEEKRLDPPKTAA